MLSPIDHYFLQKDEPIKGCLQFLREHIEAGYPYYRNLEIRYARLLLQGENVLLFMGA
jgi:hypothetical protein